MELQPTLQSIDDEISVMDFCSTFSGSEVDSQGAFAPHVHTSQGWKITLDDPTACRCGGRNFERYIHLINGRPTQEAEFVDVSLDLFEDQANTVQGGVQDILKHVGYYLSQRGVTAQDIHMKTEEVMRDIIHALETFFISWRFLQRSRDWSDYWTVFLNAFKLITGKLAIELVDQLVVAKDWVMEMAREMDLIPDDNEVQGYMEDIASLREGFDTYKKIKHNLVLKNSCKLMKYCLAFGLFSKAGLTFENLRYSEVEAAYIKEKFSKPTTFIEEVIEGTVFFLERAAQAYSIKSWSPFLYNSTSFAKWSEKAFEAKNHYKMFEANNNDEVTYSSVLNELSEVIQTGDMISKFPALDLASKTLAKRVLLDLKFLYCELTSTNKNQKTRIPPFAELVVGNSSVGKSLFTELLSVHYARVNKLPEGEEFTYHRNPGEDHWNGYKPFMHTLIYDDVGASNPKKVMGLDAGISELLPVINPNAMGANMADLDSKGHSPVKPAHVIVNANIEDMHAQVYYSFPLALRRRMPYIITVSPRVDEDLDIDYRSDESPSMLDPAKLPPLMPGEYPNQWNIEVKHVIAVEGMGDQPPQVGFNDKQEFRDIYTFLAWYNQIIAEHKKMGAKMMSSLHVMRGDEWKKLWCFHNLPKDHCEICKTWNIIQGPVEIDENGAIGDLPLETLASQLNQDIDVLFTDEDLGFYSLFRDATYTVVFIVDEWIQKIRRGIAKISDIVSEKIRLIVISQIKAESTRFLKQAGQNVWNSILATSPLRWALYALPILATIAFVADWFHVKEQEPVQGPVSSKYGKSMKVDCPDADQNPWYNKDMKVTSFDVPTLTSSWKGKDEDELRKLIGPNIVSFSLELFSQKESFQKFEQLHAVCLGGHLYVTNNHLIPDAEEYAFHIVHGTDEQGININKDETLGRSSFKRYPDRDLVFFELHVPPRQDIRGLLPRPNLPIQCEAVYVQRDINGFVSTNHVSALYSSPRVHLKLSSLPLQMWIGHASEKTQNGDCGSLMIGLSSVGPLLLGLHVAGGVTQEVEAVPLDTAIVEQAFAHFGTPVISSNTINLQVKDVLGPLHPKSIFRFMPEGHARVFGSLPTRSTMRSKVEPSILAPALERRGWVPKHGAPVMKGWKPWQHAIGPVVGHTGKIRNDILRQAGDAYLQDIFTKIPKEEIEALQVLDDLEALNGVPGVKYLEGINRNSSLGYPWQKSKKFMLVELDDDRWQDGVTFKEEVWAEIDGMVHDYESGRVTNPIFVGQLKDEAIEHRKIVIGKTRVFLISSAAWTLIMRKWYLAFVRLFQRYRHVFEGMPGLRTQSSAWGKLFKHLTKFGPDRLFAGDFEKYDKMMESTTSLEAFRVIYKTCERAGWDQLSLIILWGIAEDASYPTVIVNGDLVELEGSNPSGQALTVVINCIVNSLYMRYVYILRNPEHEALSFQLFVILITYGDDNAGAVSLLITWFHHTAIQEELALIGINYTMADKKSESRPFIHISEIEFLKRKWRYELEVDDYFAPLNEDSIQKRLMIGVRSSELTPEWQAVENMSTSMEDYFFYGREIFEEKKKFLLEVGIESGLQYHMATQKWPQFDDLLERWKNAPGDISLEEDSPSL
jgi:hypothetical protein